VATSCDDEGGGCTADDNAIDPQAATPFARVEVDGVKFWSVRWDNPVVGALYELPYGYSDGDPVAGYAIRDDPAWEYNKFDLELEVDDADGTHDLYTWPTHWGTFGDDESNFFFEAHGMKLEPVLEGDPLSSITTATGMNDTFNLPELPLEDPLGNTEGRFQLDPDVALVPLRAVVLYGKGLDKPGFSGPALASNWFSQSSAKLLFDDMWKGSKFTNTQWGYDPDFVVTEWTHYPGTGQVALHADSGGGRHLQPDRIFDQCDVQFRMVSFHTCKVTPDILYSADCDSELGQTGHVNAIRSFVDDECDIPSDLPRAIFVGSLSANNCASGVLEGGQLGDDLVISNLAAGKRTVSHELGHLLGLDHTDDVDELMGPGQGTLLNGEECAEAHESAQEWQQAYWSESDVSGKWAAVDPNADTAAEIAEKQQAEAQSIYKDLTTEEIEQVIDMIGKEHYEYVEGAIWGEPSDWIAAKPNLIALVLANLDTLAKVLDKEQYEQLLDALEG
jgi:hypothetical protein